jgi:hypothetical protein
VAGGCRLRVVVLLSPHAENVMTSHNEVSTTIAGHIFLVRSDYGIVTGHGPGGRYDWTQGG